MTEEILEQRGHEISALIIEPLVQGAGYMHMYHPLYISLAKPLISSGLNASMRIVG